MNNSTAKAKPKMTVKNGVVYGDALSAQEKKRIVMQKKKDRKAKKVRKSAQQTIPYVEMCRDGICKVNSRLYTKSIAFEDINYQLAQNEDKTAIFENWCDFLNYFDSSIFVQLSFINQKASLNEFRKRINIPAQEDAFNDIRSEYSGTWRAAITSFHGASVIWWSWQTPAPTMSGMPSGGMTICLLFRKAGCLRSRRTKHSSSRCCPLS